MEWFLFAVVLLAVLSLQYINWEKAAKNSKKIDGRLKSKDWLVKDAGRDVVVDAFDRLLVPPLDDIRRFANASLVTGIGGTMGIFLFEVMHLPSLFESLSAVLSPQGSEVSNIGRGEVTGVVTRGAIALFSSFLGVGLHLYISLGILGNAQKSVDQEEEKLIKLFKPTPIIVPPDTDWTQLDDFVKAIQALLEGQRSLDSSIKEALQQQPESAESIQRNVEKLTVELEMLPETIRKSFKVNEVFEKVARSYIGELHDTFKEHRDLIDQKIVENQKKVEDRLVNQAAEITRRIVEGLQETIEENIIAPLERMRKQLNATTEEMPRAAGEFGSELQHSAATLGIISERLDEIPDSIRKIDEVASTAISEKLDPISDQMSDFLKGLKKGMKGLLRLIKSLMEGIEGRR